MTHIGSSRARCLQSLVGGRAYTHQHRQACGECRSPSLWQEHEGLLLQFQAVQVAAVALLVVAAAGLYSIRLLLPAAHRHAHSSCIQQ